MPDTSRKILGETAQAAVSTAADTAQAHVEAKVANVRSTVETETRKAADAAAQASRTFEQGSLQQEAARYIEAGLHQAAHAISQTDLTQITQAARRFTRENPALALGAAAVLGFAAVRFLKSTEPQPSSHAAQNVDPWVGHVTGTDLPTQPTDAPARAFAGGNA